ncbi:MAG: signal peptidase II, partial [Deltaproteobacteria bacterium]
MITRSIMKNTRLIIYILISGFFLLFDQLLKYFARTNPDFNYYLWQPWLGWEYYANTGIAFSLPFPNWLIIILTPIIILGLFIWFAKNLKPTN